MDISKLTIQGFKSFYEKSTFTFDKNITAIVGPNGSGKSNITEAIRFVLGEQSTKSMRGKDVSDLLFRGNSSRATKAKVEIEFVKKTSSLASHPKTSGTEHSLENVFVKNALEKDAVIVSRTVYIDGKSEYMMNGVEVRVKDLHEFLLYIHLGNKSSWHISQGEADKVLQANNFERKTIIEDALGLKVYHSRINDSQKKLDKTRENIREATINRKEIMPELNILAKQVERIKRGEEFRLELESKASIYLYFKKEKIEKYKVEDLQTGSVDSLNQILNEIEISLGTKEKNLYKNGGHDTHFLEMELEKENQVQTHVKNENETLNNKGRKIVNSLDYSIFEEERILDELRKTNDDLQNIAAIGNDIVFSEKSVNETRNQIEENTEKIVLTDNLDDTKKLAKEIDFCYKKLLSVGSVVNKDNVKQISYLQGIKNRLQEKLQNLKVEKQKLNFENESVKTELDSSTLKLRLVNERVDFIKKQILEFKYLASETEREIQKLNFDRSSTQMQITKKMETQNHLKSMENDFENDLQEFRSILGNSFNFAVIDIKNDTNLQGLDEFNSLKRSIERLKIRLEESQVQNPDLIIKSFETMTERDNFLIKEISDLENSMLNLEKLIDELKTNLKKEFELGLEHINIIFDSYVKKLFDGGSAKVSVVEIPTLVKVSEGNENEEEVDVKMGVEVEVEIPKKKIKGLQSLSGGERALISIALNFSIVNQNPAPFMILDETDAALDEANSKRYGEILEMLKLNTKLIVVTHNRETMHFADQVYGVTLSKEGHSKVLSVSFEDAVEYAK